MSRNPAATLLQITDLHIMPNSGDMLYGVDTEKTFHATLDQALATHAAIDAILITGDLTQDPYPSAYQRIMRKLEHCPMPCICLPGNHDDFDMMRQILNGGPVNCQKQLLLSDWQIICLNSQIPGSPGGHVAIQELQFLEECLNKYPYHPTLVAVHHHCVKSGSAWMDRMMIDNSVDFLTVMGRHPQVKMVTCGHIHQELDTSAGSIRITASPSTCFQFTPNSTKLGIDDSPPAYRLIELYSDGSIETKIFNLFAEEHGLFV